MSLSTCPLCGDDARAVVRTHGRHYFDCPECGLVHLDPDQRLGPAAERRRYDLHENDPEDPGYRAFLDRLAAPLAARLEPGARGLDYGSGPGPTLSVMLRERGFPTRDYDPFYAPDEALLERRYDFVTCTETVEHFHDPAAEFQRLQGLLRPDGWLAVMTEILRPHHDFTTWHYPRDATHVCFYRPRTMEWIARRFGWTMQTPHRNVVLFHEPAGTE